MTESQDPVLLWTPSAERIASGNLAAYQRWLADEKGVQTGDYATLWRWSVDELDAFWASIWEFFDVQSDAGYDKVLGDRSMPGATWFTGARINYAEHIFRGRDDGALALQHASELRELQPMTWGELREQTAAMAAGLRAGGVGAGDRVVAYMPNIPEALSAFLACASIGAIWSSCSPDFGARTVADRFSQIEPDVLLCVDGYRYGGKDFDRTGVLAGLLEQLPSVRTTVVLPYLAAEPDLRGMRDAVLWDDFLVTGQELAFDRVAFGAPLWVLFSSGTTGLPKPIVQSQGGILIEQLKKAHLHMDARDGDRVMWFTTTGWMMWNFLIGVLLTDATIVLFDGNPGTPSLDRLWDLADEAGVTTFGTSAAYIAACMKAGVEPRGGGRRLEQLGAVGVTGSPLSPEGFRWVYDHVGADTWLFSTSGGTDVCTAFVGGVPTEPVYLGELQGRSLGCDVQAWDDDGQSLTGAVGELVITQPMPSMPIGFWGDADGSRYRESYFEMFPGVWRHGDWIELTERGTAIIYGRSDSTINRGGIRMGTAEIYSAVLSLDEIVDALVVDIPKEGTDGFMPLFVVLREGAQLTEDLVRAIAKRVREDCSPRHVPDVVEVVAQIPRTLSGKVLEVPVKRILMGQDPEKAASRDSLADPAALDWFVEYARGGALA